AFADPRRSLLEAHLLDVSGDFYGKTAQIDLYSKLRDNKLFESDELLKSAIASDVAGVRAYFTHV
ncbi:MAG TPA: riboflavin kinase, partial [Pirellula sp.]|nr:riboflavin kinase [Pirellula sp.]